MTVHPIGARVLVRPAPPPRRSTVLDVVEAVPPVPTSGQVVALGRRQTCGRCGAPAPASVVVGDVVLFAPSAGQEVRVGGRDYVLLEAADVLAVIPLAGEDVAE